MTTATKKLTASIEGEYLVIRVPMNPTPTRSATGKTLVVASSHGNKETEVEVPRAPSGPTPSSVGNTILAKNWSWS